MSVNCPNCDGNLLYGALLDAVTGQRGYGCDSCTMGYTTGELKDKGVLSDSEVPA